MICTRVSSLSGKVQQQSMKNFKNIAATLVGVPQESESGEEKCQQKLRLYCICDPGQVTQPFWASLLFYRRRVDPMDSKDFFQFYLICDCLVMD